MLVFIIVSLVLMSAYTHHAHDGGISNVLGIMAGTFALIGWSFTIPRLCSLLKKQWRTDNEVLRQTISAFVTLARVDEKLHVLAREFEALCLQQVALQGYERAETKLVQLQTEIGIAKQAFWEVHALAKQLGFWVQPSVGDYFSLPVKHKEDAAYRDLPSATDTGR